MNSLIILAIIIGILWFLGGLIEGEMGKTRDYVLGHPIVPEPNNLLEREEE